MKLILNRKSNHKSLYQAFMLPLMLLISIPDISSLQLSSRRSRHTSHLTAMQLPAVISSRKLNCREPQLRAYHLKDLMDSQGLLYPKEVPDQPTYLVVRRCDGHSGCCSSPEMVCMPNPDIIDSIYYEELEIQFWSVETRKTSRKIISVEQHSSCKCEVAYKMERDLLERRRPKIAIVHS